MQEFLEGSVVFIQENLGPTMAHFQSGTYAVVVAYSFNSCQTDPKYKHNYALLVKNKYKNNSLAFSAWYYGWQLGKYSTVGDE